MMDVLHNGRSKQNHLGGTTMVSSIFSMNIYSKDRANASKLKILLILSMIYLNFV